MDIKQVLYMSIQRPEWHNKFQNLLHFVNLFINKKLLTLRICSVLKWIQILTRKMQIG